MDALSKLMKQKRKADKRVTAENREQIINQMNKDNKEFKYSDLKIPKTATVQEVSRLKKQYIENVSRDITNLAIKQGKSIIAEIESRELKKSEDIEDQKLGKYAKDLAKAKHESDRKIGKEEVKFLERGNINIKGYGNKDMITLFENAKGDEAIKNIIKEVKNQNAKDIYYDKELALFDIVFQKVGIKREEDIDKIKAKLRSMEMKEVLEHTNYLLETLDTYGSPDNDLGAWNGDETALKNARLDDMMIRLNLKKTGKRKVKAVYKGMGVAKAKKE